MENNIKFLKKGLKVNEEYFAVWYSEGSLKNFPEGTITIYKRDYGHFPAVEGLTINNDSEYMTDYVCKDNIRVTPDNKYYNQVLGVMSK